jgi:pimeloyl-ACP methyl ester carboxylesterase
VAKFEVPYESLYVPTRFGQTHMFAAGDRNAPSVLLVQGVAGSAPLWRYQLRDLSRQFRVYALDLVGQPGRSDPNPPSFLDDSFSLWLCDVLDELKIESAHFGGISAGGWLVFRFGLFAPERTRKVVMSGPTGLMRARLPVKIWFNNWVRKSKQVDALESSLTARSYSPKSQTRAYDQQIARAMALATKHYRVDRSLGIYDERTRKVNRREGFRVLRAFFWPMPDADLRRLSRPGLLILGEHETLYDPQAAAARAKRLMPSVETLIYPGVGHTVLYDRPEEVNALIAAFLAK